MFKIETNFFADVYHIGSEAPLFIERIESKNLVVNTGRNIIRNIMAEPDSGTRASFLNVYFQWGTSATAVDVTDTTLVASATTGAAITEANISTNYQIAYRYYMPSTEANDLSLNEAGLFFGNSTPGTMFARVVLGSTITKTVDKAITFSWIQAITAS